MFTNKFGDSSPKFIPSASAHFPVSMASSLSTIKEALTPESWTVRNIRKAADASATALSTSATAISEKLYDHRLVDTFADEQQRYLALAYIFGFELKFCRI